MFLHNFVRVLRVLARYPSFSVHRSVRIRLCSKKHTGSAGARSRRYTRWKKPIPPDSRAGSPAPGLAPREFPPVGAISRFNAWRNTPAGAARFNKIAKSPPAVKGEFLVFIVISGHFQISYPLSRVFLNITSSLRAPRLHPTRLNTGIQTRQGLYLKGMRQQLT